MFVARLGDPSRLIILDSFQRPRGANFVQLNNRTEVAIIQRIKYNPGCAYCPVTSASKRGETFPRLQRNRARSCRTSERRREEEGTDT